LTDAFSIVGSTASFAGRVGIGTDTPAVALDVVGEARSSTSTTSASNAKTLTTKDYVNGLASPIMNATTGTNLPIGAYAIVAGNAPGSGSNTNNLTTTATLYFRNVYGDFFTTAVAGAVAVSGTWKCCGGSNSVSIWQRIS
jgi:hypothetical protein